MPYTYRTLVKALTDAGIEEPAAEAQHIICTLADVTSGMLMADRDRLYDIPELDAAVARRLTRYPLQYILGIWHFCDSIIEVNEHCLIPRPDTEILVEEAIRLLPPRATFADLCTGSGCIAVAVLEKRKDTQAVALELYPETLDMAKKNASLNLVEDRFTPVCADLLGNGPACLLPHAPFDAILSNPPYIPTKVIGTLSPEVSHEPVAALDGGDDGLTFYRAILKDYPKLIKDGGCLILEIGYDQANAIGALAADLLPHTPVRILRDLGGRDRVAVIGPIRRN